MGDGDLKPGEPHPAAFMAMDYLDSLGICELMMWQEAFSSTAIDGNHLSAICGETMRRFLEGEPVSDRYLLGLVYMIRHGKEQHLGADPELPESLKDPQKTLEIGRGLLKRWGKNNKTPTKG